MSSGTVPTGPRELARAVSQGPLLQHRWISVSETVKKCDVAGSTEGASDVLS